MPIAVTTVANDNIAGRDDILDASYATLAPADFEDDALVDAMASQVIASIEKRRAQRRAKS